MATDLPAIYSEAWFQPRQSIRRVFGLGLAERDRLLMVAVHFALTALSIMLMIRSVPEGPMSKVLGTVPALPRYLIFALASYAGYRFTAFLLKAVGGAFQGKASVDQCRTVTAWWMLVTSIVTALEAALTLVFPVSVVSLVNLVATIGSIIIFAAYAAEAHGFRSVPKVAGVTVAVMMSIVLVLQIAVLALVPQ